MPRIAFMFVAEIAALGGSFAVAQDYGLDFVTVGAPGNRGTLPEERPGSFPNTPVGSVPYEYRITRTEVTADVWARFANAYAPYWQGPPTSSLLTGSWVNRDDAGVYRVSSIAARYPTNPSWEVAARFANWLCNNQSSEAWAFETGAYDTSTFTTNPDGTRNDQLTHTQGARFWIPSFDEQIKAAYFDPDRYGQGAAGYWLYPQSSNDVPIPGVPGVGTTNASLFSGDRSAGQYSTIISPWGLLDTSGGEVEMSETTDGFGLRYRLGIGTSIDLPSAFVPIFDRIDALPSQFLRESSGGFRIASVVPAPSSLLVMPLFLATRRRRSL